MVKKQDRKEETRRRMLQAASQSFRSHGFVGIGVDGIARMAGVTSGAFYAHFGSKEAAFNVALDVGLEEVIEGIPKFQRDFGGHWVKAFADYYLGQSHRENLACGCALTTLSPEVVRASSQTHAAFEEKIGKIADLIAEGLDQGSGEERRARAWAMLGILIGGLTIARAVQTSKASEEISAAIRAAAVHAAGVARKMHPQKSVVKEKK